jgi:hypothetical protein
MRAGGITLVLAWVSLMGCGPSRPQTRCVLANVAPRLPVAAAVGHAHQRVTLPWFWDSGLSCPGATPSQITHATVEVLDPEEMPLPAAALLPWRADQSGVERWQTTVLFSAEKLGPHHVTVTFEPQGGVVQDTVWVVVDRTLELPERSAQTPGAVCSRLELLPSGSVACEQPQRGVVLFHERARLGEWPTATFRSAGEIIWVNPEPDRLVRVSEVPGGGLEQLEAKTNSGFGAFAARADEAIVWSSEQLTRVTVAGAAPVTPSIAPPPGAAAIAVAWSPAAQSVVAAAESSWTRFALEEPYPSRRWNPGARAAHQADDGLWLEAAFGGAKLFAPADPTLPLVETTLPFGWETVRSRGALLPGDCPLAFPLRFLDANDDYPSLDRTEALVPVITSGRVAWHHFHAPAGASFQEVSGGWLRATDGETHHFFRVVQGAD